MATSSITANFYTDDPRPPMRLFTLFSRISNRPPDRPQWLIGQSGILLPERGSFSEGAELIGMALDEFRAIKRRVGGKLVMIEREDDRPKLLTFYQSNGFKSWTKRDDAKDMVCYDQMFAAI